MACRIDHITVTAASLEAGTEFVFKCLGVMPQPGGEHPRMGTHNMLLRLGNETFLEVISVNPAAEKPLRPRWFELDAQPASAPKLACWVARTNDIHKSLARTPEALGVVEPVTRGNLTWLISIPEDGSLPSSGVAPVLIQWRTATHPALHLEERGCHLVALKLLHPDPARINSLLHDLSVNEPGVSLSVAQASNAGLVATVRTPLGLRIIGP